MLLLDHRKTLIIAGVISGSLWTSLCQAETCQTKIISIDPPSLDAIRIEPGGRRIDTLPIYLDPFQRIVAQREGVTVELEPRPKGKHIYLKGGNPPHVNSYIAAPCPPAGKGVQGMWDIFWSTFDASNDYDVVPGSTEGRLAGSPNHPLHDVENLIEANGAVSGMTGLAFAWAGGQPPYRISIEDEAGANLNGSGVLTTDQPYIWLPQWRVPTHSFVIRIIDKQGDNFNRTFYALPAPSIADASLADDIALLMTKTDYGLEALRRIAKRASAGDIVASNALSVIKSSRIQN